MSETTLRVPELHCAACDASVRKALAPLPGIGGVEVNLESRSVVVRHDPAVVDRSAIQAAIEGAGFDVQ